MFFSIVVKNHIKLINQKSEKITGTSDDSFNFYMMDFCE